MRQDTRLLEAFGIAHPILQAPMAGANDAGMAIAVCEAGGLGALPTALFGPNEIRAQVGIIRQRTDKPFNLNFFVHEEPAADSARERGWAQMLAPFYAEHGLAAPSTESSGPGRAAFDGATCALVEELRPRVVSFHFGLPRADLAQRVRAAGAKIIASATTVEEARWLEERGIDAIIAQGAEAGGHRGMFLTTEVGRQPGLFALLPLIVDAVRVPVIAAGGIGDARGIAAALLMGASAVQLGTAYLFTPEARISPVHRAALQNAQAETVLTNIFTGRPARGIVNRLIREMGAMRADAPTFPRAAPLLGPLRAAAEKAGSGDFSPLWSGQAAALGREMGAGELTRALAREAEALLAR